GALHRAVNDHLDLTEDARMPLWSRQRPQAQRAVVAAADGPAAVGSERGTAHLVGVAFVDPDLLAGGEVPQAHRLVGTGGQQTLTVGRDGHVPHALGVPFRAPDFLAGLDVPDADGPILATGRDEVPAVRREDEAVGRRGVPLELADF